MVNMRMWLLVTKDQNSKFPIDRSFSELLTSKLVLELPSHVASFSLCRRRRGSRKSMGVFRSPARKAPQEATKAAPSSQPSKTVTIRPAKLPLGPHATEPLCGAHEKLQQMMGDFVDDFPEKSRFLIGNCRELDHVLIFSGRLGCLGVAKPCTNCRIAAITQ